MGFLSGYNRIMVRNARFENIRWRTLSFRPHKTVEKINESCFPNGKELHVVEERHVHRRAQPKNARLEDKLLGLVLENVHELGLCRDGTAMEKQMEKPHGK